MEEMISIVTDEVSQDLVVCREFLAAGGIRAIELRCVSGRRVPDLSRGDRATLCAWALDRNPQVLGVSPGLFKCDLDDRATATRHLTEVLPKSIDLARDLKAQSLVAFTFESLDRRPATPFAIDCLAAAAEACAEAGLPLLIENEPGFLASTGAEVRALLDAVDHGNLHVNWDPANAGDLSTLALDSGLREIIDRVRHVHVKNGVCSPGQRFPKYGPLSAGDIDWPAHLALLAELGYEGYLGIETHYEPLIEGSRVNLDELRTMIGRTTK